MSVTIIATTTNVVNIDPNGTDAIRLNGTVLTDGFQIKSGGTAGEIAVLTYYAAGDWYCATDAFVTNGS